MASGRITGTMTGDYGLRIDWTSTPDVATNTSSFTMKVYVLHPAIDISTRSGCYTTIDGSKVEFSTKAIDSSAGATLIKTRTATIAHNGDGTKSIKVVAYFPIYVKSASEGWIYEKKASGTCVLDAIPRSSEISSQTQSVTVNGENKWSIAVSPHVETFRHKATLSIGSYSYTTPAFATTAEYAIPTDWLNAIPNAQKGTVSMSLQTYSDEACTVAVGDAVTSSFEMVVPQSAAPVIAAGWASIAPYNTGTAAAGMGVYVQGYSKAEVTFDSGKVSAQYGAGIAEVSISWDGTTVTASPWRTKLLSKAGSQTVRCTATDTRGLRSTQDMVIHVEAYSAPTLSGISIYRCNNSGTASDTGTYILFATTCAYASCGGENTLSLKAAYKPVANTVWTSESNITSGVKSILGGGGISATASYNARIRAVDRLGNAAEYTTLIGTADVAFNIKPGGKGAAFGKYAEKDKTVDADDWDIVTTGNVGAAKGTFSSSISAGGGAFTGNISAGGGTFTGNISAPNLITPLDIYPVGSIYMSVNATSPQTLFGGTWARISDCFLLAAGSTYAAGSTGGKATHSHTLESGFAKLWVNTSSAALGLRQKSVSQWNHSAFMNGSKAGASGTAQTTGVALGGSADAADNMPPYLSVYVWKRTA